MIPDVLLLSAAIFEDEIEKKAKEDWTYSSACRTLKKDKELLLLFRETYKKVFDHCIINNDEGAEGKALATAISVIEKEDEKILKSAGAIPMGDAGAAGKSIAELVKFLMQRISDDGRPQAIQKLKRKITALNENDIAGKQLPNSSASGHAISVIKYMLFSHSPQYIRSVLDAVVATL